MHHTWSMENYKRFHAGERIWWFIGIICFCVKAAGTAHTELIHLMTNSFRIGFVVGWYFYWSWYKIALHGKACCIFSVVLHLPNCKSDVIVLADSPVVSLVVVPSCGRLEMPGVLPVSFIVSVFQALQAFQIQGWSLTRSLFWHLTTFPAILSVDAVAMSYCNETTKRALPS